MSISIGLYPKLDLLTANKTKLNRQFYRTEAETSLDRSRVQGLNKTEILY